MSEAQLLTRDVKNPQEEAAVASALLAILYGRWRNAEDEAFDYVSRRAGQELWVGAVLPALNSWRVEATTWEQALTYVLSTFVVGSTRSNHVREGPP